MSCVFSERGNAVFWPHRPFVPNTEEGFAPQSVFNMMPVPRGEGRVTDYAQLLENCAGGDRASLRTVMDAEGGRMLGVALRMLRRRDLAEDAVQESFVTIWRKAHQYDRNRGAAKAWIYTILRNRCLTMLRQDTREIATESDVLEMRQDSDILSETWERLGEGGDLQRCLERLDAKKRAAVLMAYVLGYTHGEISGRVGAPLGSVKSWLRRGLAQLRECLS